MYAASVPSNEKQPPGKVHPSAMRLSSISCQRSVDVPLPEPSDAAELPVRSSATSSTPSFTSSTMSFNTPPLSPSWLVPAEEDVFPADWEEDSVEEPDPEEEPEEDPDAAVELMAEDGAAVVLVPEPLFLPHAVARQSAAISMKLNAKRLIFSIITISFLKLVCAFERRLFWNILEFKF